MSRLSVRYRIIVSFAAIILLVAGMGLVSYFRLASIEAEAKSVDQDSVLGLYYISALQTEFLKGHILFIEHDWEKDGQAGDGIIAKNRDVIKELLKHYETTVFLARDRELMESANTVLDSYWNAQDELLKSTATGAVGQSKIGLMQRIQPLFAQVVQAFQNEVDFNKSNAQISTRKIQTDVGGAKVIIFGSFVCAILFALVSGSLLLRAITKPLENLVAVINVMQKGDFTLRAISLGEDEFGTLASGLNRMAENLASLIGRVQKAGTQVSTSVTEIAATVKQQQATANEIAATTSEIGATSKEISATSKELAKTMNEVAEGAEQTTGLAGQGQAGLNRMEETMRHVMEAVSSISAKLAVLNEKAGNINQVITTITKVADQTNLLSLNAAIEAEKAGEYGRGFAVVATEIRRLADQTAVATYDIEQTVKEMLSAVSAGVMGMDKFAEEVRRGVKEVQDVSSQLSQIIQQVQQLTPRFETVSDGMRSQTTGAQQISDALSQLSEAAHQTVESLRQSNQAIGQLDETAGELRDGVTQFKLVEAR